MEESERLKPMADQRQLDSIRAVLSIIGQVKEAMALTGKDYTHTRKVALDLPKPLELPAARGTLSETLDRFDGASRLLLSVDDGMLLIELLPPKKIG